MKVIKKSLRTGTITVKVENADDLWYLSQVIDAGDLIKGRTFRKIRIGDAEERSSSQVKKPVTLMIQVEKVEFHKFSSSLRVSGTIAEGTDEIPKGAYHTFTFEEGTIASIIKERWLSYQLKRIDEAAAKRSPNILLLVHDREDALFALITGQGYELLAELSGEVEKKVIGQAKPKDFFKELAALLGDYAQRYKVDHVVIASPAFWKEELLKQITDQALRKKVHLATCSSVTKPAIDEVLKRPELSTVLKEDRVAQETGLVEELMKEIQKTGLASYGIKETGIAAGAGAVRTLLVTDSLIRKMRSEGLWRSLEEIMQLAEAAKGEIAIINSENDAGKQLDGLGGIGAVLRFKLNY